MVRLRWWLDKAFGVVIHLFIIRRTLCFFLMLIYEHRKDKYVSSGFRDERLRNSMISMYEVLYAIRLPSRDLGIAGLAALQFYVFVPWFYHAINWFYRFEMSLDRERGILSFINNFDHEIEQIKTDIEAVVIKTRDSLIQFRSTLRIPKTNYNFGRRMTMDQSIDYHGDTVITLVKPDVEGERLASRIYENLRICSPKSVEKTDNLIDHLEWLLSTPQGQASIWPTNKSVEWQRIAAKRWTRSSINSMLIYYVLCFGGCFLEHLGSYNSVKENLFIEPDRRKLDVYDNTALLFRYLFAWWALEWAYKPIGFLVTAYFDIEQQLSFLVKRFKSLNKKLDQLNYLEINKPFLARDSTYEFLYNICDSEALTLYVEFQIFAQEAALAFKRAERDVVFIFGVTIMHISVYTLLGQSPYFSWNLYPYLSCTILVMALNLGILPGAVLNERCMRLTKSIWSLVAQIESLNSNQNFNNNISMLSYDNNYHPLRRPRYSLPTMAFEPVSEKLETSEPSPAKPIPYHISPHTQNSWRQLIVDTDSYSDMFSCRLLKMTTINYSVVLRWNFNLLSLITFLYGATKI